MFARRQRQAKTEARPLRTHILRTFLINSVLAVLAATLLAFGTNKFTEDAAFARLLNTEIDRLDGANALRGWHSGALAEMPQTLQPALAQLPHGEQELNRPGLEISVVKRNVKGVDHYALIALPDSESIPLIYVFVLIGLAVLLSALAISVRMARQFSSPLEKLAAKMDTASAIAQPEVADDRNEATGLRVSEVEDLARRLARLKEFNNARLAQETSFAESVSHELRTPITVIQGAVELLIHDAQPTRDDARLARIDRALKSMRLTVETLLYLAQAERALVKTEDAFPAALKRVVAEQQELASATVSIQAHVEDFPTSTHQWAPLLIALQTLLANAVRYTHSGVVSVEVGRIGARVLDTGAGMTKEEIARAVANRPSGGELGFAIVHRICDRCGWQLRIEQCAPGLCVSIDFYAGATVDTDTQTQTAILGNADASNP